MRNTFRITCLMQCKAQFPNRMDGQQRQWCSESVVHFVGSSTCCRVVRRWTHRRGTRLLWRRSRRQSFQSAHSGLVCGGTHAGARVPSLCPCCATTVPPACSDGMHHGLILFSIMVDVIKLV